MRKKNSEKISNSLYYAKDNLQYTITSAPELGILKSLGVVKDARVCKKMTHWMGGPVLVKIESSEIAIGKDIAEKIMVRG